MAGYKNRSAYGDTQTRRCKRAQQGKGISCRLVRCLYHSESKPMRYPAKIAHSGMIFFFRVANP